MSVLLRKAGEAGRAYRAGAYGEAAEGYEALLELGAASSDLYFNLGSAHYHAGRPGEAAWAYESGLRLRPGDEAARAQLETLRAEVGVRAEPAPLAHRAGARIEGNVAGLLLIFGWLAFCAFLYLRLRRRRSRVFGFAAALALLVALAGGAGLALVEVERRAGWAVILDSVEARLAPHDEASALIGLEPSARVRIQRREGDWTLLRLGEEMQAWVPSSSVAAIPR